MAATGKILILKLYHKILSILLADNQILSIHAQKEVPHAIGNIYVGRVQNISLNIGAAFVDLGEGYLTFLPLSEARYARITNRKSDGTIKCGDELLVQIVKEPMKTKVAGVTTKISLSGNYAVVGIQDKKTPAIQVSSKIGKAKQNHFRDIEVLQPLAQKYSLIVRTNASQLETDDALIAEATDLADQLHHILDIADKRTCYSCLHHACPDFLHFIQNIYRTEYDEVITDLPEVYMVLEKEMRQMDIPLRLYQDKLLPLYKLYAIENRIQELLGKKVWLKSGGYLIIEPTEALISIDVNSGKCETGKNKEETFFKINKEAAQMIAIHLRARNLSGMILVDFINLNSKAHETELMEYMRSLLKRDNVTSNVVDMTGLGLMELTRKKISPCFAEQLKS